MALRMSRQAVARANIEHIDKLGAFSGKKECRFYYRNDDGTPDGCRCAIGWGDRGSALAKISLHLPHVASIDGAFHRDMIACSREDLAVLMFIQNVHDVIVFSGSGTGIISGEQLRRGLSPKFIPDVYCDFIAHLDKLNKRTYLELMRIIADG